MSLHVSDDQLRTLLAADPDNEQLKAAMRQRVRWQILRALPSERGTWRGRPVKLDDKGTYSTGYWGFTDGHGYPPVETWDEIVRTPDPERERLLRLLDSIPR